MIHTGDVTLPDGRIVHGRVVASTERDTNAVNIHKYTLEWKDGDELTADEEDEVVGDDFLHEFVIDALLMMPGEYEDYD